MSTEPPTNRRLALAVTAAVASATLALGATAASLLGVLHPASRAPAPAEDQAEAATAPAGGLTTPAPGGPASGIPASGNRGATGSPGSTEPVAVPAAPGAPAAPVILVPVTPAAPAPAGDLAPTDSSGAEPQLAYGEHAQHDRAGRIWNQDGPSHGDRVRGEREHDDDDDDRAGGHREHDDD